MARGDTQSTRRALARNIRRLRLANNLSQEALADAANLRQAQISELESGKSNITLDNLQALANALGVRVADLFEEGKRG
jgi:transcriptional regulator with XRE-family HTH domain